MTEETIVRQNLMDNVNYRPYCGNSKVGTRICYNPRTQWTGEQFVCPHCKWVSEFPIEFIARYKEKHGLQ